MAVSTSWHSRLVLRSARVTRPRQAPGASPEACGFGLCLLPRRGLTVLLGFGPPALLGKRARVGLGLRVEPAQFSVVPADVQVQEIAVTAGSVPRAAVPLLSAGIRRQLDGPRPAQRLSPQWWSPGWSPGCPDTSRARWPGRSGREIPSSAYRPAAETRGTVRAIASKRSISPNPPKYVAMSLGEDARDLRRDRQGGFRVDDAAGGPLASHRQGCRAAHGGAGDAREHSPVHPARVEQTLDWRTGAALV